MVGVLVMGLTVRLMNWVAAHPEKDILVAGIGIAMAVAVAVYAAVKPYPADYDAEGKLLVDGAKMANDTFEGIGWCSAFLVGWILERRFVGFSTDISMVRRVTRVATGLLSYYAVSLILVPFVKGLLPGAAGTIVSCFVQILYVSFVFPPVREASGKERCAGMNRRRLKSIPDRRARDVFCPIGQTPILCFPLQR